MKKSISAIKSKLIRWMNTLYPMPSHFGEDKLQRREKYRPDYRILSESLLRHIYFESMIDVGCAQGFLMESLNEKGVQVSGIEISANAIKFADESVRPKIEIGDFSDASGSYDLVCCVEVAEHIEPARSQQLVEKLCVLSSQHIYFTAAPPGQGGHGHINCRPHSQWMEWFSKYGYNVNKKITKKIRNDLKNLSNAEWLKGNSFLLQC